nr:triacylglycerol lipase [Eubacterium sp.]
MEETKTIKTFTETRLKFLSLGSKLLAFFLATVLVLIAGLLWLFIKKGFTETFSEYWVWMLIIALIEAMIFWIGIILVYVTSVQLGVKLRAIGLICGLIPIVHLVVLFIIIRTTSREVRFERAKIKKNNERAAMQICKTRYPILMVHGVFFRDFRYFNYWGRIPGELEKNGATIYYGNHQSAAAVEDSAAELTARVKEIVEKTGCEKVNVIAHSKGGLDTKTAVAKLGLAPYIASITTINTPHLGCEFAEYLLGKAPAGMKEKVSAGYNAAFRRLGDPNPDFIAAVTDLTASKCKEIWDETSAFDFKAAGIYTQSVGSC